MRIERPVEDAAALEALYGEANPNSLAKETPRLTPAYRAWIGASRFFVLATIGPEGVDASPRGDAAGGAFEIADDATILIPDRRGNNRLDSLRNIVRDGRASLLFLIPGVAETLRVRGRARLAADEALRARFDMGGRRPATVIVLDVEAVYFQCARALVRAALWEAGGRPAAAVPSAGEMTRGAMPGFDAEGYDAALRERQAATLY